MTLSLYGFENNDNVQIESTRLLGRSINNLMRINDKKTMSDSNDYMGNFFLYRCISVRCKITTTDRVTIVHSKVYRTTRI